MKKLKIAVAISSFKSNDSVARLVHKILDEAWEFNYLLVVDSLGDGLLEKIDFKKNILYYNSSTNLGSAGNLAKRFEWACELGMDFILALNHDADISIKNYEELVNKAKETTNAGAFYPLRYLTGKGIYDLSGKSKYVISATGRSTKPAQDLVEVVWSSSNGALYSMEPLRKNKFISPDATLWMGWEDYCYGLLLMRHGYKQYIVTTAESLDNYEYKEISTKFLKKIVADKPMWYGYYDCRNMIIIALHRLKSPSLAVFMISRSIFVLFLLLLKFERNKKKSLSCAISGIVDGIRNVGGKWNLP